MTIDPLAATCPAPRAEEERVLLGHGSGGRLMAELLTGLIGPALGVSGPAEDAALVDAAGAEIVISTDGFVVTPRFFPGGDIGSLAVHGTVNDLAMMGARPLAELRAVTESAARAAAAAGARVVTGDTKVVGHGAADGIYVTTTGVGVRLPGARVSAGNVRPGDVLLISGPIGLHGTAIMSARDDLGFGTTIVSDSRPLHGVVAAMVAAGGERVHALRDPTRGGLAAALNELAAASGVGVELDEQALPVPPEVAAACDLLGLDPLHVANEGCLVAFVAPEAAAAVLAATRTQAGGTGARRIGAAVGAHPGQVRVRTLMGATRVVDMLVGEQLPRIC